MRATSVAAAVLVLCAGAVQGQAPARPLSTCAPVCRPLAGSSAVAKPRGVSTTMRPVQRGGIGDSGRGHRLRDRRRDGFGDIRNGVDVGIEIADVGIETADIGLRGPRGRVAREPGPQSRDGAIERDRLGLRGGQPASNTIGQGTRNTIGQGQAQLRAREFYPDFARGGDRFFLIREGGAEYVLMIDAEGRKRILDGVDAIRRGEHLR